MAYSCFYQHDSLKSLKQPYSATLNDSVCWHVARSTRKLRSCCARNSLRRRPDLFYSETAAGKPETANSQNSLHNLWRSHRSLYPNVPSISPWNVKIITPFWVSWPCPFWSSAKCSFRTWTSSVLCFSAVSKLCLGLIPSSSILTCRNSWWKQQAYIWCWMPSTTLNKSR